MMARLPVAARHAGTVVACAALVVSCATNPVTGRRQLALISESQEIAMGREADKDVSESIGLYPDDRLQQYVQGLGSSIAARTERPGLPWTFRVVDDAAVNAFAIPGGFVYVTRGIMAYLNSEAELAAVLGHEIGHVTARHSVVQISQQQLAQMGLIAGMIASPKVAQFGGLAQMGLGLMFLKFSRQDESEADRLGFRYMLGDGYDPREMVEVFRMLEGVSSQEVGAQGRLPQWLSSHPDPENRQAWASRSVASLNRDLSGLKVARAPYVRRLDGLVFGENPRDGFFQGALFRHPDLAFRVQFPAGWKGSNQRQAVGAASPNGDAVVVLKLAQGQGAAQAARQFFSQEGVQSGGEWRRSIGGLPATSYEFTAQGEQVSLHGLAAWVEYGDHVYQILGYSTEQGWSGYARTIADSMGSFGRETDAAVLGVKPRRLSLVSLSSASTPDALLRQYPSTVPPTVVGLINHFQGQSALAPGEMFKRVVGGPNW